MVGRNPVPEKSMKYNPVTFGVDLSEQEDLLVVDGVVYKKQEPNLLEIKVKDMDSVPRVFYQGKEVMELVVVNYEWETRTSNMLSGKHAITIKAYDGDGSNGIASCFDTIEYRRLERDL